ncbi:hypothetical protein B0H14DRAFT_2583944 [Mycena olivaceomarginata]|nr:hypothetical protein B0H14DRAFT_2583944 [Mycena olivaceomarginata]
MPRENIQTMSGVVNVGCTLVNAIAQTHSTSIESAELREVEIIDVGREILQWGGCTDIWHQPASDMRSTHGTMIRWEAISTSDCAMGHSEKERREIRGGNRHRSSSEPSIDVVVTAGNGETPPRLSRITRVRLRLLSDEERDLREAAAWNLAGHGMSTPDPWAGWTWRVPGEQARALEHSCKDIPALEVNSQANPCKHLDPPCQSHNPLLLSDTFGDETLIPEEIEGQGMEAIGNGEESSTYRKWGKRNASDT